MDLRNPASCRRGRQRRNGGKHGRIQQAPDGATGGLVRAVHLDGAGGRKNRIGDGVKHLRVQGFAEQLAVVHQGSRRGLDSDFADAVKPRGGNY